MRRKTIVVGYDGSDHARQALEASACLIESDGTVHVVTAYHPASYSQLDQMRRSIPEEFRYVFDPEAEEEKRLEEAKLVLDSRGVRHDLHLVADDPASAILDVAERVGADLIVVGSRGLGGVQRFVRGSVSARVATHAPTSVLVVHDGGSG